MPDRMSSSGVPNAPSARITSRAAQVSRTDLRTVCRTDTHRVPVKPSRTAREPVSTVRFGGGTGAGSPAPTGTWPGAGGRRPRGQVPVNHAVPAALGDVEVGERRPPGVARVRVIELGQPKLGGPVDHRQRDRVGPLAG